MSIELLSSDLIILGVFSYESLVKFFYQKYCYFSEDTDTVSYALDALCNMMNDSRNDVDPQVLVNIPPDLGKQFTEIFVKDPENVQLVLSFLSVSFGALKMYSTEMKLSKILRS